MKYCYVDEYADDTSLMFGSDVSTQTNDCVYDNLSNLKSWLQTSKLSFDFAKTHSLVIDWQKEAAERYR